MSYAQALSRRSEMRQRCNHRFVDCARDLRSAEQEQGQRCRVASLRFDIKELPAHRIAGEDTFAGEIGQSRLKRNGCGSNEPRQPAVGKPRNRVRLHQHGRQTHQRSRHQHRSAYVSAGANNHVRAKFLNHPSRAYKTLRQDQQTTEPLRHPHVDQACAFNDRKFKARLRHQPILKPAGGADESDY